MKKILLFCLFGSTAFAQSPISTFYGLGSYPFYIVSTTPTPLDQSASGANVVWNFDQLVEVGSSESETIEPTAEQVTTYPNTTLVNQTNTILPGTSYLNNIYFSDTDGTVSINGASNADVSLNLNTDNATLGTFPMAYGFSNSDTTAGSFTYGTYNGTFTGTMNTTVDAYGTLSMNLGNPDFTTPVEVTRLKTVLTLSLTYIFPNIGTIEQTTYSYYASNYPGYPIFRSTTNDINVPLASIDQETTTYESFMSNLLSNPQFFASPITIAKNPVRDVLEIAGADSIQKITVSDMNGRIVLEGSSSTTLDVSGLKSGVYTASITQNNFVVSKKFSKQ